MNIHHFNKKLRKIAALTDTIQTDNQLSTLERDLLLSYIRELYDIALDDKPAHPVQTMAFVKETNAVIAAIEDKPKLQHTTVTLPAREDQVTEQTSILSPKDEVKLVENLHNNQEHASISQPLSSDALTEIFAEEKVTDLSDRLSLSSIPDLTKSMGINERIFTQHELFGNDQTAFNEIMAALNQCKSYSEAKQYLTDHVIFKYGWTNENKVKKATTFVRHIKRKYV